MFCDQGYAGHKVFGRFFLANFLLSNLDFERPWYALYVPAKMTEQLTKNEQLKYLFQFKHNGLNEINMNRKVALFLG